MKKFILLLLFAITVPGYAALPDYPEFTITLPTAYTDGAPLNPVTDLRSVNLECTEINGAATLEPFAVPMEITGPVINWSAPLDYFSNGTWTCEAWVVSNRGVSSMRTSTQSEFVVDLIRVPGVIIFTVQ